MITHTRRTVLRARTPDGTPRQTTAGSFFVLVHVFCSAGYKGCPLLISRSTISSTMSSNPFSPGPVVYSLSQWAEVNLSAIIRTPIPLALSAESKACSPRMPSLPSTGKLALAPISLDSLSKPGSLGARPPSPSKKLSRFPLGPSNPLLPALLESFSPPPLKNLKSLTTFPPRRR